MHIYGYGKMKDVVISPNENLHVFYGENEAGKSTIMSFIHSILFGFPTKVQAENRYEPKEHSNYGGKILLETKEHGETTIQRLRGKATGDVMLTYSNGKIGDEEDLKKLLQGMDKATYQSIFSFDLDGLHDLHKMSEDEISRYLLSTGLLGNDHLLRTEDMLQKEMDQLFKPGGKNPTINTMLTNTKGSFERLTQAAKEQEQYEQLLMEYKELEQDKQTIDNRLTQTEQDIITSYNYQSAEPLLNEYTRVHNRLLAIGEVPFPREGEERYQQLKQAHLPLETNAKSLQAQTIALSEKMKNNHLNESLWQEKEQIQRVLDQATLVESLTYDLQEVRNRLREKQDSIQQQKDYIHLTLSDDEIKALDSSAFKKERVLLLEKKQQKLQHDKQFLDEQEEKERRVLQSIDKVVSQLEERLLQDEQRQTLKRQVDFYQERNQHLVELKYMEKAIENKERQIRATKQEERSKGKKHSTLTMAVLAVCAILMFTFMLMQQWIVAVGFGGIAVLVWFLMRSLKPASRVSELIGELEELKKQVSGLQKQADSSGGREVDQARFLLERDDEVRQQIHNEQIKKIEHEEAFHRIVDEFERWEQESVRLSESIADLLLEWRISDKRAESIQLSALFDTITSIKQSIYDKQHISVKMKELEQRISAIQGALFTYCQTYANAITESYQEAAYLMRNVLSDAERIRAENTQNKQTWEIMQQQLDEAKFQLAHIEKELQLLYQEAECEDEATYLERMHLWKEKQELLEKRDVLIIQLKPFEHEREQWEQRAFVANEYSIRMLEEKKATYKQKRNDLTQLLAEKKHMIQQLEEGGTFDERFFQHHTDRSALNEEAKQWMIRSIAKNMLQKAVNEYKDTKFPQILHNAERYMKVITNGEYIRMRWSDEDGGLILQRKDGLQFEAREVSRGTQEGIYVALRLSLAGQSFQNEALPIIIDDSFVNFDIQRTKNVVALLKELQQEHQIIFFTCHDYLLSLFSDASITKLSSYK